MTGRPDWCPIHGMSFTFFMTMDFIHRIALCQFNPLITLVVAKFCRLLNLDMVTVQEAMQQQLPATAAKALSDHDGDADRHARLIELRSKLADVVNAKVTTGLRSSSSSRQS